MAGKGNESLKSLLRKAALPEPNGEFTGNVMREVESLSRDDAFADAALRLILKDRAVAEPGGDFTDKVLWHLQEHPYEKRYDPVIGKRYWVGIGVGVLIYVIITCFVGLTGGNQTALLQSTYLKLPIGNLTPEVFEFLSYLEFTLITAVALLGLDGYVKRRFVRGWRAG